MAAVPNPQLSVPLVEEKLVDSLSALSSVKKSHATCTQCGKSMRHMPVFLQNITCRDCYGRERYRRGEMSMISPDRSLPTAAPIESMTS